MSTVLHRLSPDDAAADTAAGTADPYGRIGRRLIPFLLVCYLAALIDRLNLGFAKLQFLADLHLDEAVYGVAAGVLYLGYVVFEVPSNLLLTRIGIRRTLLRIMVLWGLFTAALAFAGDRYAFYALRFLLGAAEAGFFPGVVFYLTLWFPRARRGRVLSLFAVGVPLSGVVAGPLSGLIMAHMGGVAGLKGWQWLFLFEGLPAVALGVAAFLYLPDGPGEARFLSARERERVARDLEADRAADRFPDHAAGPAASRRGWREPRLLAVAFVYFAFYAIQSLLLLWVPTLLKAAGVADLVEIGWRAGAVSLAGAIGMVALGFSSDRTGERRFHLVGAGAAGALLFVALPLASGSPDATVVLLGAAAACIFGFLALFWTAVSGMIEGIGAGRDVPAWQHAWRHARRRRGRHRLRVVGRRGGLLSEPDLHRLDAGDHGQLHGRRGRLGGADARRHGGAVAGAAAFGAGPRENVKSPCGVPLRGHRSRLSLEHAGHNGRVINLIPDSNAGVACRSTEDMFRCASTTFPPFTVPPSASTGCSRSSTRCRAWTPPPRPIRPTTSSGPARTPIASPSPWRASPRTICRSRPARTSC